MEYVQIRPNTFLLRPPAITARQKNICRELAYLHLERLGADILKPAVRAVVEMVYPAREFREAMEKITKTPLSTVVESLTNDGAGTRAKSFLKRRDILDVERLVRLRRQDVEAEFGFGLETANALELALKKNSLRLGMLFLKPLGANAVD